MDESAFSFENIVEKILSRNPEFTREKLLELVEKKRDETGKLLNREGAVLLVASDLGVPVAGENKLETGLKVKDIVPSMRDVTLIGRVLTIDFPRDFKKIDGSTGKFQRIFIADDTGMIDVFAWNEKVEEIARLAVQPKDLVRLEHAYSRQSLAGKVELNIGSKGKIVSEPPQTVQLPSYEDFFHNLSEMKNDAINFNVRGTVVRLYPPKSFQRAERDGNVQRIRVKDETGEANLVAWNSKVDDTKSIVVGDTIEVFQGKVKENMSGELEIHLSKRSTLKITSKAQATPISEEKLTPIAEVKAGMQGLMIEGLITSNLGTRQVILKSGNIANVTELILKDETGEIQLTAWRTHADVLSKFPVGARIRLKNIISKPGFKTDVELTTISSTEINLIS